MNTRESLLYNQEVEKIDDIITYTSQKLREEWDPLQVNQLFIDAPSLHRRGAIADIRHGVQAAIERYWHIDHASLAYQQLIALSRDGVMLVTSATLPDLSGPSVDDAVPGSSAMLQHIADLTGLPPRNVDDYYTDCRLSELSSRRFTDNVIQISGDQESRTIFSEDVFRAGVREGKMGQDAAISKLLQIPAVDTTAPDFPNLVKEMQRDFYHMVIGITTISRYKITDWFAKELLPYLKPYGVNGVEYVHSGEQMVGMLMAHHFFIGADSQDEEYYQYVAKNVPYAPREICAQVSQAIDSMNGRKSFTSELIDMLSDNPSHEPIPENLKEVTLAIFNFLSTLATFRNPHYGQIIRSLGHRPDGQGSGGDIDMPPYLLRKTNEQLDRLKPYIKSLRRA
ncbi:MAG TPA: monodechloroaminopyrrolnitrin synthase PrnB family protein [Patescibacteria group bacterium]|nr:monodechloroaminopyrrolnitrin synthase PrnB family protein [Patescibacteria group bacterium]